MLGVPLRTVLLFCFVYSYISVTTIIYKVQPLGSEKKSNKSTELRKTSIYSAGTSRMFTSEPKMNGYVVLIYSVFYYKAMG